MHFTYLSKWMWLMWDATTWTSQWAPKCGSLTSSISISWKLLEMQILRSYSRATEPRSLGGAQLLCFQKSSKWFWHVLKPENRLDVPFLSLGCPSQAFSCLLSSQSPVKVLLNTVPFRKPSSSPEHGECLFLNPTALLSFPSPLKVKWIHFCFSSSFFFSMFSASFYSKLSIC